MSAHECDVIELEDGTIIRPHGKGPNGEPLYDADKVESFMREKALSMVEDAADRIGLIKKNHKEALDILKGESAVVQSILIQTREAKKELVDITRSMRMTVKGETSETLKRLEEVRAFFLGSEYDEQKKRLNEFCDLCERLRALKEDGFIDAISDTILKLA